MMRAGTMSMGLLLCLALPAAAPADERQRRMTPDELAAVPGSEAGAGTSGIDGIRMTVLSGDPAGQGLYTIRLSVPANVAIAAHTHRDERVATVVSGTWYFGYGARAESQDLKALAPGSFYTEPADAPHFARTGASPVVLHITGYGPTDTHYVDPAAAPRRS